MCHQRRVVGLAAALLAGLLWVGAGNAAPLQGSEWKPVRMGSLTVAEDVDVFVQFRSKGRLEGHGGCNRLFAKYEVNAGHIFIGPVAATRMACEESLMALEAALATALEDARTYQRVRTKLVLFDSEGTPILEMRQTDWD